jgi:uncharacterized glyoxalase superfamily protein PhnB
MAKKAKKTKKATKVRKDHPVPVGFHTITPSLVVRDAAKALEFYQKALGAKVRGIHHSPDGKIMHADVKIGDSILFFNDEYPDMKALSPLALGGTAVTLHIYSKDVDSAFERAVEAGAKVVMPVNDAFWGDRYGQLEDPFGHRWSIASRKENLSQKEMEKRGQEFFAKMAAQAKAAGA